VFAVALRRGNCGCTGASAAGSGVAAQVIWPVVQPDREQRRRLTANRVLAPAIFALLVVATVAAFAAAQRLKREPLILDKVTFNPLVNGQTVITPNGDGQTDLARIVAHEDGDENGYAHGDASLEGEQRQVEGELHEPRSAMHQHARAQVMARDRSDVRAQPLGGTQTGERRARPAARG